MVLKYFEIGQPEKFYKILFYYLFSIIKTLCRIENRTIGRLGNTYDTCCNCYCTHMCARHYFYTMEKGNEFIKCSCILISNDSFHYQLFTIESVAHSCNATVMFY
jgi:hypothetical protein